MSKKGRRSRGFWSRFSGSGRKHQQSRRRLMSEQLENRLLLAGDMSAGINPQLHLDGNNDGAVTGLDALVAINYLNKHGSTTVAAMGEDPAFAELRFDYNADGHISPADPLAIINKLAEGEGTTTINVSTVNLDANLLVRSVSIRDDLLRLSFPDEDNWGDLAAGDQILLSNTGANGFYTVSSIGGTMNGDLRLTETTGLRGSADIAVGKVINSIGVGQNFLLGVLGEDVQAQPGGPFAVYTDVIFNSDANGTEAYATATALDVVGGNDPADPTFNFQFNGFLNDKSGDILTPGLINEAGAFRGFDSGLGAGQHLVFVANMKAGDTTGTLTIMPSASHELPSNDILLNGENDNQCTSEHMVQNRSCNGMVMFISGSIDIVSDIVAVDDGPFTFNEDSGPQTIDVLANDSVFNPPNTTPTLTAVTQPTNAPNSVTFTSSNVTFTPPAGVTGDFTFTYTITNGQNAFDSANVDVTVAEVNDEPINSVPGPQTTDEDIDLVFSSGNGNAISVTDPDGDVDVKVDLTPTLGTISIPTPGNAMVTTGANGLMTLSGIVSDVNNALNGLTYTPNSNASGAGSLRVFSSDPANSNLNDDDTVNITINPINDPPINTVPGPRTLFNTQTLTFGTGAFQVSDVDSSTLEVNLTVGQGTLQFGSGGTASNSLTATGSISSINAQLDTLIYDPINTFIGDDTLTMTTSDQTGGMDTDNVTLTVTPPQIPFAASDLYKPDEGTSAFTLNPNPLANDLMDDDASLSVTNVNSPANPTSTTGTLSFSGGNFTYTPPTDPDFFGTETFTYTIEQDPAPSSTGDSESTGTITVEIQPINDGPINSLGGNPISTSPTINGTEDTALPFSGGNALTISDIDAGSGDVTVTLRVNAGTLNVTATGGVQGNGGNQLTIDGTVSQVNNALGGLTYTPSTNFFGDDALVINTNDNGNTGASALSDSDTVNITIAPVNDPPTLVVPGKQSFFTDFDNRFSSEPAPFSIADVDAGTSNVQLDLTIGDGTLTISSTSGVTVEQNPGGHNGIRISGTVSNVNNALASGLTYNTSVDGNKTLNATVNDLGNTGSGGSQTASDPIDIEVLDFVPIDIVGQVFMDLDGNDVRDSNEPALSGVDLILSGTDFQGNTVNVPAMTDANGQYVFPGLKPNMTGQPYTITQSALPGLQENQGESNITTVNLDQKGNITVESGDLMFTEGSLDASHYPIYELFSLSNPVAESILIGDGWSIFTGWGSQYSNARFTPDSTGDAGTLTVYNSATQTDVSVSVSSANGTLTHKGPVGDRVYRITGGPSILSNPNPEGEDSNVTATDIAFASLFAR